MEITLEEIQQKFESLPEDIKWAIMAVKVDDKIIDIGQARGLNVEQMGQLSLETHMVMLGFVHPDKFEASLKGSLGLPDDKNKEIVNDVNEKILKGIREKLMSLPNAPEAGTLSSNDDLSMSEKHKDTDILKQAGIEIMPEELKSGKINVDNKSLSGAKLSNTFKIPSTKTEHTIDNIKKSVPTPPQPPYPSPKTTDPYRMPIE